jgi:hypothetical protein
LLLAGRRHSWLAVLIPSDLASRPDNDNDNDVTLMSL